MNDSSHSPSINGSPSPPSIRKYSILGISAFMIGIWNAISFGMIFIILGYFHSINLLLLVQGLLQLCLAILPIIGVILGIIAVVLDIAQKTQRKVFSIIGLILNFLVMTGYYATLVIAVLSFKGPL